MKKVFYCAFILIFSGIMFGAEAPPKRKMESDQLPAKRVLYEKSFLEKLPTELRGILLNFLVTAEGNTDSEKLRAAAKNIRSYMRLSRTFKPYLNDEKLHGFLIQELANRYAHGSLVEATVALHTAAGGRWFANWLIIERAHVTNSIFDPIRGTDMGKKELMNAATILGQAIDKGNLEAVSFIISYVPQIIDLSSDLSSHVNNFQTRPLVRAAKSGNRAIVQRLLEVPGIDIMSKHEAAEFAIKQNDLPILDLFLKVIHEPLWLNNALLDISKYGNLQALQLILMRHGLDVNFAHSGGRDDTPLMNMVKRGNLEMVQRLLADHRIDVNIRTTAARYNEFHTALTIARQLPDDTPNKIAIIDALLAKGARE